MTSQATISSHVRRVVASSALMRVLGAFLVLHGVAHFAGTEESFAKAADGGPSTTSPTRGPSLTPRCCACSASSGRCSGSSSSRG